MAALGNKLWWLWLGVSLGLSLCEPSTASAMIQWLWYNLSLAYVRPTKKVRVVLLRWFGHGVALALSLGGPSKKAVMLQALWSGLGLALAFAFSLSSKKAAMAARLRPVLGHAAAAPSKKTAPAWTNLLLELLGLVLSRVPSRADRVRIRIRAVCRSWRRSGARPLPPLLPWFALRDGTFLSLPDGAIHRMPVPDYGDVLYRVSTGSMLFLVDRDGGCSLMNPSSGKTTPLQINPDHLELGYRWAIRKVVVSDDLHIVAVVTTEKTNLKNVTIYARGPQGTSTVMEWAPPVNNIAVDIAIFHGELYVLTTGEEEDNRLPELHILEAGSMGMIRSIQCIRITHKDVVVKHFYFYLVASGDRLLMVGRIVHPDPKDTPMPSRCFKVFEAADLRSGGHGWWSKVDTLMGHALFVSQGCSRSLAPVGGGQSVVSGAGAQEDCIYFMSELPTINNVESDFLDSCVYNMRDQTVAHLPLETQALSSLTAWGVWFPTWLFPAEEDV